MKMFNVKVKYERSSLEMHLKQSSFSYTHVELEHQNKLLAFKALLQK